MSSPFMFLWARTLVHRKKDGSAAFSPWYSHDGPGIGTHTVFVSGLIGAPGSGRRKSGDRRVADSFCTSWPAFWRCRRPFADEMGTYPPPFLVWTMGPGITASPRTLAMVWVVSSITIWMMMGRRPNGCIINPNRLTATGDTAALFTKTAAYTWV